MDETTPTPIGKRPRKSRGRGLRTTTGCLTCRKRHKKCDEKTPVCSPCSIARRVCTYPSRCVARSPQIDHTEPETEQPDSGPVSQQGPEGEGKDGRLSEPGTASTVDHGPSQVQVPLESLLDPRLEAQSDTSPTSITLGSTGGSWTLSHRDSRQDIGHSPETVSSSSRLSAGIASTRWLDLLAADAAQADSTFSLVPSPVPYDYDRSIPVTIGPAAQPASEGLSERLTELVNKDNDTWQCRSAIQLQPHEISLFRLFADRCAPWLDVFDTCQHFSTYATRVATRNHGLMKAVLALSAKYAAVSPGHALPAPNSPPPPHVDLAVQYYYETLHYVSTALHHQSYAHSEELLATALVISTYEMLDAARGGGGGDDDRDRTERSVSNWQRHLKGVFWIQRSQDVDGASGGLRQAVWWAWLRQDIWAAFRERRRCFSFWRWKTPIAEVPQDDLPSLSIYLLKDAVNYCADDVTDGLQAAVDADTRWRAQRGVELMAKLDQWQACLGDAFKPLPSAASWKYPSSSWAPIWVHPPRFAVALQAHSFARILVCLHEPPKSGFQSFMRKQRILASAVATICGLAMELKDEGCQVVSAQCLFGAGLCVEDRAQQATILALISECEARSGWPMCGLREDLRKEWSQTGT